MKNSIKKISNYLYNSYNNNSWNKEWKSLIQPGYKISKNLYNNCNILNKIIKYQVIYKFLL